jgi:hypothetical protein
MSVSSGDDGSIFDYAAQGPGLVAEFHAGWEGWLEGAHLAQLASDEGDAVCVAVLHAGQNGFLVVAEEGDFPCTGPWHHNGWVDDYSRYYCFSHLVYMDPFDERIFDSLGGFSAHMGGEGCIVYNDQAGRHCWWLDAGNWWIFCCTFLLLEVPIEQNITGFLGWVTGVVADLLNWVGGGVGLHPQVMEFASVFMRFLLVCGGSVVFPLHLADEYWPCYQSPAGVQYDVGLAERLQRRFLSFMLCACNYIRLMWLDATWVGRESVPCLGYERWPLAGPIPFREVWCRVVSTGSQLDFLMHSVVDVPYKVSHSPSSQFLFEFYGCPPNVGSLGSFLTYA